MRRDVSGWWTRLTQENIARNVADGAWSGELLHERVWARAAQTPDRIALIVEDGPPATIGEIADEARALAGAMAALGLRPGDVVSFQLPNWREAAAINIAASALGLVINPIVPIYRGAECQAILRDARAKLIFIPETIRGFDYPQMIAGLRDSLPDLRGVVVVRPRTERPSSYTAFLASGRGAMIDWPKVDPNAVKLILYTSGTTGRARGVLHTHNTLAAGRREAVRYWRLTEDDVVFMPSPVTHVTGYVWALELPFVLGMKAALMMRWNAADAVDYIQNVQATLTVGSAPFLQELIAEAERRNCGLPSLRMFACGGAAVPADLIRRAHSVLSNCRCHRMYGATEAPAVTRGWMGPDEMDLAAETDGKIVGWEVKVTDAAGTSLPQGMDGEIIVRGPALMVGYNDPEQTAASFTPDGFFLTGDIGHITAEGAVVVTGRKKDLIIRGGENLSAKEIEDVLQQHAGIREAAVVSMPHPRLGEGVCAFIIPADLTRPPSTADILAFVEKAALARQKIPERIEFLGDFPRTPSGKVRKDMLRASIREILEREQ